MENCLVTKLKASVNNDALEKLGILKLKAKTVTSPSSSTQRMIINCAGSIKITCFGTGYINASYERLDVDQFKTITLNSGNHNVFVSSGDYDIEIENRYAITGMNLSNSGWFDFSNTEIPTEQFKYNALTYLVSNNTNCFVGNVTNLVKSGLTQFSLEGDNKLFGNLSDFGIATSITSCQLNGTSIVGIIEDFVSAQYSNGRTSVSTSSPISMYHVLKYSTLNGHTYNETYSFLTWSSNSKIAIFAGSSTFSSCPKVYTKGYSSSEASTAFPGKTIIRTDA